MTHAPPAPPNPNVWRFPAAVPSNAVLLVRTSANLYTAQPAPLINPHITTSLRSSHVQAAAGAQNYVTSDFMQANPFSSSTGTAPTFVTPIIPPTYGATVPNPLCWGGPPHPTPSAPSLDSADLIKQLADAITCKKNDPLPEWKLSQDNGDPLQCHEWFGQFKSAIDSQSLTDDIKLTYLKTLVTGKAKTAIAEFAYCGVMYKDALKTLERKFGQPQAVVSAHLEKLSSFPPQKMHNSDNIIDFSATISSLVVVFKSLSYDADLKSASLLNTAVQKLPPNLKESWSIFTVKKHWVKPTLLDSNDWLKEKVEAHDLMKQTSSKARTEDNTNSVVKTKVASRTFAANTQSKGTQRPASTSATPPIPRCIVCKGNHRIWECRVFKEKSPTQRAKVVVEAKLCFSCLREKHMFRQCPNPRKCRKDGCNSSHNTLLHGAERVYPSKSPSNNNNNNSNSNASANQSKLPSVQSSSKTTTLSSVSNVKGLLQVTELQLKSSSGKDTTALVLCDTACSNSWVSNDLANRLGLHGTARWCSKITSNTTVHNGKRYNGGMLWAEDNIELPNNYFSALVQLKSLEKRLTKDKTLREKYSNTIKEDLDKGYVVRVKDAHKVESRSEREWYLPHPPVVNPNKPGKVRRVLNGAAKYHGASLKKSLLTGPDLLQNLIYVLLRFRQHLFAVSADFEGMFLQVGVLPCDQPSLRFLWREDPT